MKERGGAVYTLDGQGTEWRLREPGVCLERSILGRGKAGAQALCGGTRGV